jgi:hypothetical protein
MKFSKGGGKWKDEALKTLTRKVTWLKRVYNIQKIIWKKDAWKWMERKKEEMGEFILSNKGP